jgi:hypothetical protein
MTKTQYCKALAELNLTPYSAARVLGISLRQSHRYASGEQPVKATVALLLQAYLRHGLPVEA